MKPMSADDGGMDGALAPLTITKTSILTHQYSNLRTGANLQETALSATSVGSGRFGLVRSLPVQGSVYAEPLFVPELLIGEEAHDVLFVATEHDDMYAFDVGDPSLTDPLWHVSFGAPIASTDFDKLQGSTFRAIIPEVGITSTPVIDLDAQTIYVFAQTKEDGFFRNRLHALDLASGKERSNSPIDLVVSTSVFTIPDVYLFQRPALALSGNTLWLAGGGHGDWGPYHGWVLAIDKTTLSVLDTWTSTPNGKLGGIWQSGAGPAIDETGDVYVDIGNGTFDPTVDPPNLGNSLARVHLDTNGLSVVDWFTPFDQALLNSKDWDLGTTGMMLIPETTLALGGSKRGTIYVVDRSSFGHTNAADDSQIVQSFTASMEFMFATPVFWAGAQGKRLYTLSIKDSIHAFRFDGQMFETTPYMTSNFVVPTGIPGGALSLSADGNKAGTGVLWALTQASENNYGYDTGLGALHAFDADDLGRELYDSSNFVPFDYVKFTVPAIAAGKVFVGTASNEVLVFGLR
jgi:hypothetical protein